MAEGQDQRVPVTLLSGFLGSGKTTIFRYLLQNTDLKIGCIVNDVASVNIDAKLIRNDGRQRDGDQPSTTSDLADTIELANGCACCSIADELLVSFENLLQVAAKRGITYDRIVVENSGVAEPQNIRDQFNEAITLGHPLMKSIYLDTLITVVDSHTFIQDYSSKAPLANRPDLGEGGGIRPVVDLLVEQIECADFVVLNKCDLLDVDPNGNKLEGKKTQETLGAIVASLNPLAKVEFCEHGIIPIDALFGKDAHGLVARLSLEGQHRGAIAAVRAEAQAAAEEEKDEKEEEEESAVNKKLKADGDKEDMGHHHHGDHNNEHHHHDEDKHHHHHHDHEHKHDHEHHEHDHCTACETGEGEHHHHHHDHKHKKKDRQATTAAKRFGIVSFVYMRRKPFHPQRLKDLVLKWMPVTHNKTLDGDAPAQGDSAIKTVLRSKGFMWLANSHTTAFYWSHAGQHFEIRDEGEWWTAVPDSDWPDNTAQKEVVLSDFDLVSGFGDRRQEIVFIGAQMDEAAITAQLDGALLTDEEMEQYREQYKEMPDPIHADVEEAKKKAGVV